MLSHLTSTAAANAPGCTDVLALVYLVLLAGVVGVLVTLRVTSWALEALRASFAPHYVCRVCKDLQASCKTVVPTPSFDPQRLIKTAHVGPRR